MKHSCVCSSISMQFQVADNPELVAAFEMPNLTEITYSAVTIMPSEQPLRRSVSFLTKNKDGSWDCSAKRFSELPPAAQALLNNL